MNLIDIAVEFFRQWRAFSIEAMALLIPSCPTFPKGATAHGKYTTWEKDGPQGLLYHFAGPGSGLAHIRWSNENKGNTSSSWNMTIFDHCIEELEPLLDKYPLVERFFPVTAILHSDIERATWHGYPMNHLCSGVENVNWGRLSQHGGKYGAYVNGRFLALPDQSRIVESNGIVWHSYTRGQLIANINLGKLLVARFGSQMDKRLLLPHQFVWASKSDTGNAFPMYWIREAVCDATPAESLDWLKTGYSAEETIAASDLGEDTSDDWTPEAEARGGDAVQPLRPLEPMSAVDFDAIHGESWRDYLPAMRENLTALGGYCMPPESDENEVDDDLELAAEIFQSSTAAKWTGPKLKRDGIPGESTRSALEHRLRGFGYDV